MESEYSDPGLRQKRRISSSNPMTSWQKADTFPFMLSYISIIGKGEWRQMLDTLGLRMFQFFTVDNCVWLWWNFSIRYNRIRFYESFLPPVSSSPIQTKVVANLTKLLSWICLSPFLCRFTTLIALVSIFHLHSAAVGAMELCTCIYTFKNIFVWLGSFYVGCYCVTFW